MEHLLHLQSEPFRKIASGEKTVELRLFDEKRQKIAVGDTIRFLSPEGESLCAAVTELVTAPDFAALFEKLPPERCGFAPGERPVPDCMDAYYSPVEQEKWGALGILLKLL